MLLTILIDPSATIWLEKNIDKKSDILLFGNCIRFGAVACCLKKVSKFRLRTLSKQFDSSQFKVKYLQFA